MGWRWCCIAVLGAALLFCACNGEKPGPVPAGEAGEQDFSPDGRDDGTERRYTLTQEELGRTLDELAELERSGVYVQGLGIAESGIREDAGDYAGATAAAYKELAWAYGMGLIQRNVLEEGLGNVLALQDAGANEGAIRAAKGITAFVRGQWDEAGEVLAALFNGFEEPDSFANWMILACALEKNRDDRQAGAAYRAMRARYTQFPEYWFRGARAFAGIIGAEYAEQCINAAPLGPFAAECRNILALQAGLKTEDGAFLKSKLEIEGAISQSISQENPEMLASLMPLVSLPDNPYTIYALGALRALASVPKYRDYFNSLAAGSKGRLAERLAYICRG